MSKNIMHVFYDSYMGWSHGSLTEIMKKKTGQQELGRGEVAIFINKAWSAVKVLAPGNIILYYRTNSKAVTIETIKFLPSALGGSRLTFERGLEANMLKAFEKRFGSTMKRLKVANA